VSRTYFMKEAEDGVCVCVCVHAGGLSAGDHAHLVTRTKMIQSLVLIL